MALNVTIDGFIYDKNSVLGNSNILYQAYFYSNGTTSSTSKWNDVRLCEASGYYNINLGSGDWLTQNGHVSAGSKVVVVFWIGGSNRLLECNVLLEWGAFEFILDNSSTYTNNAQTMDNIEPNLYWTTNIPTHPYVDTIYNLINTSDDEHSWVFGSTTMHHWYNKYGQIINGANIIEYTDILWGDTYTSLGLNGASGDTHSYTAAGTYEIGITVVDNCGASVSGTTTVHMYWHEPVPNITMIPANPLPNETINFQYSGTDIDNRITTIEWVINDSGSYGNTNTNVSSNRDDVVSHSAGLGTGWYNQPANVGAFTNPGVHVVNIIIHWNDGFNNQTLNYSANFTQARFTGPDILFIQNPILATTNSGVTFVNTSINTNRVGLGMPDHEQYTWNWDDSGVTSSIQNVDHNYQFTKTPTTADCLVELCADWSDGWDTMYTCLEKAVTFRTTVTVTPEECYYIINVVGTSNDGTVNGYGWTVSSGTSISGVWNEVWRSPIDINQQQKTLCFSDTGWYKVEGFVYGTGVTTYDSQTLYIDETCPDSGTTYTIWNGTGSLDTGSDWVHIGHGVESTIAVYRGTNGMLVSNSASGNKIIFHRYGYSEIDINNYDFLSFWLNIKTWEAHRDVTLKLFSTLDTQPNSGKILDLSNYLMLGKTNEWQRVMIPLKRFKIKPDKLQVGWPTHVNSLEFFIEGEINFWLDDVALVMGELITLPICTPGMETTQVGSTPRPPVPTTPCPTPYPRPAHI